MRDRSALLDNSSIRLGHLRCSLEARRPDRSGSISIPVLGFAHGLHAPADTLVAEANYW